MKESQTQARVKVAALALARLYPDAASFRNDLFVLAPNANIAEIAEVRKKKWQSEFLTRLCNDGVATRVQEGSKVGYLGDTAKIENILQNMRDGDGALISGYLWPNASPVNSPEISQTLQKKVPTIEGHIYDDLDSVESPDLKRKKSDNETPPVPEGDELTTILKYILDNQNILSDDFKDKFSDIPEVAKKIGGFSKRLDKLDESLAELRKVVHANQSVLKPAMQSIDVISGSVVGVEKLAERVQGTADSTDTLKASIDQLTLVLEKDRQDKIGQLLQKLDTHVNEGQLLRDMTLELVSNDG